MAKFCSFLESLQGLMDHVTKTCHVPAKHTLSRPWLWPGFAAVLMNFTNIHIHFIRDTTSPDMGPTKSYQVPWKERSILGCYL